MANKCFNCGADLIWESDFNADEVGYEEEGIVTFYTCPNCGADYQVFIPINNKPQ